MAPPPAGRPGAKAAPPANALNQLTPPTMALAVIIMLLALSVVYYMVLYLPLSDDLTREIGKRSRNADNLRQARVEQSRYQSDVDALERSRIHARDLQRVLPDNADIPGFMRSINTLAESSGLQIQLIQPDDEHIEEYFVRVPVRIEMTGSYLALGRFFRSVSQLPRVINMENITLDAPAQENGEVRVHARMLATTFRSRSPSEIPPSGTTAHTPGGR